MHQHPIQALLPPLRHCAIAPLATSRGAFIPEPGSSTRTNTLTLYPKDTALKPARYYGYPLLAAAFVAQFVSLGIYSYVLGSFMGPMTEDLAWSRADFTLTRTIGQIIMAFVGFVVGARVDAVGARPIMAMGRGHFVRLALFSQRSGLFAGVVAAQRGCPHLRLRHGG